MFVSSLPLAIRPWGCFLGRLMKSADWAWGIGNSRRVSLIKSATIEIWASSSCPNNEYSSKIVEGHNGSGPVDDGTQFGNGG